MNSKWSVFIVCAALSFQPFAKGLELVANADLNSGVLNGANGKYVNVNQTDGVTFNWADRDGDGSNVAAEAGLIMGAYNLTRSNGSHLMLSLNDGISDGEITKTSGGGISTVSTTSSSGNLTIVNATDIAVGQVITRGTGAGRLSGNISITHSGNLSATDIIANRTDDLAYAGNISLKGNGTLNVSGKIDASHYKTAAPTTGTILIENYNKVIVGTGIDAGNKRGYGSGGDSRSMPISLLNIGAGGVQAANAILNTSGQCGSGGNVTIETSGAVAINSITTQGGAGGGQWIYVQAGSVDIEAGGNVTIDGTIDTRMWTTYSSLNFNAGDISITNAAGSITLGNVFANSLKTLDSNVCRAGNLTINAAQDIVFNGFIDLSYGLISRQENFGILDLKAGNSIKLKPLDLGKVRYAKLDSDKVFINSLIYGDNGATIREDGNSGELANGTKLRAPASATVYYNAAANPDLNGKNYTLADLTGTAGAGGTLTPFNGSLTTYSTVKAGNWNDPTVWDLASVPSDMFAHIANVKHDVVVDAAIPTVYRVDVDAGKMVSIGKKDVLVEVMQNFIMGTNACIASTATGDYNSSKAAVVYGSVVAQDTLRLEAGLCPLDVRAVISGNTDLWVKGRIGNDWQASVNLYGANTFYGDIEYKGGATYLFACNAQALGTKPNLTIDVLSLSGGQGSFANRFGVMNTAISPANLDEVILRKEENKNPSYILVGRGVTFTAKITMAENSSIRFAGTGTGARYITGDIVLPDSGFVEMHRNDGSGAVITYVDSLISGDGSLKIIAGDGNSTTIHFRNNASTYAGGTYVSGGTYGADERVYGYNGAPFGTGPLWIATSPTYKTYSPIRLGEDAAWNNAIRGNGRINTLKTGSTYYTLTLTGSLAPFDTGYGATPDTKVAGNTNDVAFTIDKLQFGSNTKGATYYWQYAEGHADVVTTTQGLTFGSATKTINIEWLGNGVAPTGSYPIFTFTGTAPTINDNEWNIVAPRGLGGKLSINGNNVVLTIDYKNDGTVIFIR